MVGSRPTTRRPSRFEQRREQRPSWHYLKKSIALSDKLSACECARHCKQIVWFRSSFDCPGFDTSRAPDEPKLGNGAQHAADHHVGARDTGVSKLLLIGLQYLHRALEA